MKNLAIPSIHLNGTAGTDLRKQLRTQAAAIRTAIDVLTVNSPHGRDYYTQGPGAYETARAQHTARIEALRAVYTELLAVNDGIQDQLDARETVTK